MRVGPERWRWVTIDSAGVPTGGQYGQVQFVAEMIEPLGLRLAWSHVWRCFCVYEARADGRIIDHFHFRRPMEGTVIPLTPIWFEVFRYLRERWGPEELRVAMLKQDAKEQYEAHAEYEQEMADMESPVMDAVSLNMGLRTPRAQIVVPSMN